MTSTTTTTGYHVGETARTAYLCHVCNRWFLRGNISCSVYHSDGHCHYGDTEVSVTAVGKAPDAAKGPK